MTEVDFSVINIKRCLCPECPVQAESICVEGKWRLMQEIDGQVKLEYILKQIEFLECTALPGRPYAKTLIVKKCVYVRDAQSGKKMI